MILDSSGHQISGQPSAEPSRQVEIVRSVSFKLNLGGYQSMDFFCSRKEQCGKDEADTVSADLYEWCYEQVLDAAKEVQRVQAAKAAKTQQ